MWDGLVVGLLFAAAEAASAVATGRNLSAGYVLAVVGFDVGIGLVAATLGAAIRRLRKLGDDYVGRFLPLAGGLVLICALDKLSLAVTFRGSAVARGPAIVAVVLAGLFLASVPLFVRIVRTRQAGASTVLSLALVVAALIGVRHLGRSLARLLSRPSDLAAAGLLVAIMVAALVIQDRWLSRPRPAVARWVPIAAIAASFAIVTMAVAAAHASDERRWRTQDDRPAGRPRSNILFRRPNVLLISIDTLRADSLSVYGYERDTTPNLRALAEQSLVFTHAVSPGTWTVPGHAAMLTGYFPGSLGSLALHTGLPANVVTLAERLHDAGYRTGAVVANAGALDHRMGWAQGFDSYDDAAGREFGYLPLLNTAVWSFPRLFALAAAPTRKADEVNAAALGWLDKDAGSAFFLFINYMDVHDPYMPPEPWTDRYPGRRTFLPDPVQAVLRGQRDLTSAEMRHFRAVYDGAVAFVDDQVGRLVRRLDALGVLDDTVVIITSDHGEFLGEHRLFHHVVGPFEPVHRIPLIIRYPRAARRGVEHGWVQLVDIVPTVLDVLGLPSEGNLDGGVLPHVTHPILIQQAPNSEYGRLYGRGFDVGYTGIYAGPHKLVAFDDGSRRLFDVVEDPQEREDVRARQLEVATVLGASLNEANATHPRRTHAFVLPPEVQERLRAGGYVQ